MKAIRVYHEGGPEELVYEDAPLPKLQPGDALVHVYAAGITPTELTWSATYTNRDGTSRLPSIPGHDLSGVVERIAADAADVKVGDAVYALTDFGRDGTAAEYVAVRMADLAPKPRSLSHEQAAAVPLSALTAWQALFDHGNLGAHQRVLIHGAAGGVGTFAIQIARWRGAHVIGTASAHNAGFLRTLGADEVIDYTQRRFEDAVHNIDLVIDTIGGETLERSWRVLRSGGSLVSLVADPSAQVAASYGIRAVFFIVKPDRSQLIEIAKLIDQNAIRPFVSAALPLEQARRAFEQGAGGHNRGKLVLRVVEPRVQAVA